MDQRQLRMPFGVSDLIHADGGDRSQAAMRESPLDDMTHRLKDPLPRGMKGLCGLLPRELARPMGQKEQVRLGQLMRAVGPRQLLDLDPAARAGGAWRRARARRSPRAGTTQSGAAPIDRSPCWADGTRNSAPWNPGAGARRSRWCGSAHTNARRPTRKRGNGDRH